MTSGQWMIVPGGGDSWQPLRTALTTSVSGLVIADFDGDGYADGGRHSNGHWQYAARGWGGFVDLRAAGSDQLLTKMPVGRFDGDARADVLVWSSRHLAIAPGAKDPVSYFGTQDMR